MITSFLKRLIPNAIVRRSRLAIKVIKFSINNDSKKLPIIIFAMPKSGTSTVETSLIGAQLARPIYKIHRLSERGIQLQKKELSQNIGNPLFTINKLNQIVRRKIINNPAVHWQVISLTREPIAQAISGLFQVVERHHSHLINTDGSLNIDATAQFLKAKFESWAIGETESDQAWYAMDWFDREMKQVFKVDVYEHPYSHEDGFMIVRDKCVDLLVIRSEDLNRGFDKAVKIFLNSDDEVKVKKSNLGQDKRFFDAYVSLRSNLKLPRYVCEKIYSSKYAVHFYTDSERAALIEKWADA